MNLILYCLKRFFKRNIIFQLHLIFDIVFHPSMFLQLLYLAKLKQNSNYRGLDFICIKNIELGHSINIFIKHVKLKTENRINIIKYLFNLNIYTFPLFLIRKHLPSSTNIQLYTEDDKNYIVLNGNGRIYAFKQVNKDIKVECEIYRKK